MRITGLPIFPTILPIMSKAVTTVSYHRAASIRGYQKKYVDSMR